MALNSVVKGLTIKGHNDPSACETCIKGQMTRTSIPKVSSHGQVAKYALHVVQTNIYEPLQMASKEGSLYSITYIDEPSRRIEIYSINKKGPLRLLISTKLWQKGSQVII